jgi:hypothetical protein
LNTSGTTWALVTILTLGTSACASAVGWGKRYEVVHSNSRSITIKYDSVLADFKDFAAVVDSHCAKYGREAVPEGRKDTQANTIFGGVQTIMFRCE